MKDTNYTNKDELIRSIRKISGISGYCNSKKFVELVDNILYG
jgi:hypothetical protein